jgi:hypothetical protein
LRNGFIHIADNFFPNIATRIIDVIMLFTERLVLNETRVVAIRFMEKFVVCALFEDEPVTHDEDAMSISDCREPMCDSDCRPA